MTGHAYSTYGLRLHSDLELPEYEPDASGGDPDIVIRLAPGAAEEWRAIGKEPGRFHEASGGGFVLSVPEVAVYHVTGGAEIRIAPDPDAEPGMVRLFTIGSAMGMALHQRGVLVLHGATVALGGKARILVGDSGAGKSTLAARLGQAGCTVLGDDTMALWPAPAGRRGRWLWQGSRVFKLWQDSIEAMGLGLDGLDRLGNRHDKFFVPNPVPDSARVDPAGTDLAEILILETGDGPPRVEPLTGLRALQAVAANTYRPEYVPLLRREAEHFRQCGDLARDIPVGRLIRPWGVRGFDRTLALLIRRWAERPAASGAP